MRAALRSVTRGGSDKGDVALREVHDCGVDVVGHVGATLVALPPAWAEHEVLHQQLAVAIEQGGERPPLLERVEQVVLPTAVHGARVRFGR